MIKHQKPLSIKSGQPQTIKKPNEFAKIQVNPTKSDQIKPLFLFQLLTPKFHLLPSGIRQAFQEASREDRVKFCLGRHGNLPRLDQTSHHLRIESDVSYRQPVHGKDDVFFRDQIHELAEAQDRISFSRILNPLVEQRLLDRPVYPPEKVKHRL